MEDETHSDVEYLFTSASSWISDEDLVEHQHLVDQYVEQLGETSCDQIKKEPIDQYEEQQLQQYQNCEVESHFSWKESSGIESYQYQEIEQQQLQEQQQQQQQPIKLEQNLEIEPIELQQQNQEIDLMELQQNQEVERLESSSQIQYNTIKYQNFEVGGGIESDQNPELKTVKLYLNDKLIEIDQKQEIELIKPNQENKPLENSSHDTVTNNELPSASSSTSTDVKSKLRLKILESIKKNEELLSHTDKPKRYVEVLCGACGETFPTQYLRQQHFSQVK